MSGEAKWQEYREQAEQQQRSRAKGERGERGEKPHHSSENDGRKAGESGRILGEFAPFEPEPYPVEALGPLAAACAAIAEGGQIEPAMAGQCLLSAAALLTQSRANVRTLAGIKPLSLFLVTVGESGDGKSTADDTALHSIHHHQRKATALHRDLCDEWEQRCMERTKKDPKPDKPREPYLLTRDGTVEGIRRGFAEGLPSQGVFTAEAAVMLAGYGMNADNRAKTAGAFNALWDDGEISVSRSLTGRLQLYDRRLSLHWLIQPDAATEAINDPLLSNIGFWPRFLVAWPAPSKPRKANPFRPEQDERIGAFWARCAELLADSLGEDCGGLPVLEMTSEAHGFACQFFERMEQAAKSRGGKLETVKPFALRATEQLFRVAGVLACFGKEKDIGLETARGAGRLVAYSLETWLGIFGARQESEARAHARTLFAWLQKQPEGRASETAMLKIGPKPLRSKSRRDAALAVLEQAGLIVRSFNYWSVRHG
jgi:hypothetical protein